ncbi:MAG: hypothetical protein JKY65_13405 [Planctomycetes bacterium]|nr:hypothetical protein [Planctomycetota bacterium]
MSPPLFCSRPFAKRPLSLIAALLLLLATASAPARAEEPVSTAERKRLQRVVVAWLKLGSYGAKRRLADQARDCLAQAREALPDSPRVAAFAKAAKGIKGTAKKSALKAYQRKAKKTRAEVAKIYEGLAASAPGARRLRYLARSLRAERAPSRWKALGTALPAAWSAGARAEVSATAKELSALDPPADLRPLLEQYVRLAAVGGVVLRRAKGHAMRYYLSLPASFDPTAKREWAILVAVDGAGSNFEGCAKGFAKARGDLPCLVVSPCGFANTNAIRGKQRKRYLKWYDEKTLAKAEADRFEFDRAGLIAILDELREEFGTSAQACITGFSGGGNLTYQMIFRHPERLLAAAPACANFTRPGWAVAKGAYSSDALQLPIYVITGGKDPHRRWTHGKEGRPGIEPQTDEAIQTLEAVGFSAVKRTLLPNLGHSPARAQVMKFFGPYLRGDRKRSDPPADPR